MVNDLLYNSDDTFKQLNGDFDFGDAQSYLMEDILLAVPGAYKEAPTIGANVYQYINARGSIKTIARDLKVALKADVFAAPVVDLSGFPNVIQVDNFELRLVQDDI